MASSRRPPRRASRKPSTGSPSIAPWRSASGQARAPPPRGSHGRPLSNPSSGDRLHSSSEAAMKETTVEEQAVENKPAREDVPFTTISGRPIEPLYRPRDVAGVKYDRDLADPGQ